MSALKGLEPREIWFWFEEISKIPRPSGQEEEIADFIENFALERELNSLRDSENNVLIRKPGQGGRESASALLLQAHVDIVAEKTDNSRHDHSRDPIVPEVDGDWVKATETTLGADNGIGVSMMLAVLDSGDIAHPPLECLFTTDEERGLTGAGNLDPSWITARRLINLDSEEDGIFTIGCAGGLDVHLRMAAPPGDEMDCFEISLFGLKGGHSGMEIGSSRANAISLLARVLHHLMKKHGCLMGEFSGGTKRNAIPRSARALVHVPKEHAKEVQDYLSTAARELAEEYRGIEENIALELNAGSTPVQTVSSKAGRVLIDLLLSLPHGVQKMSGVVDGLVETSCNLALASLKEGEFTADITIRSPLSTARYALGERICATARLAGADCSRGGQYPGWIANPESELLSRVLDIYRDTQDREPKVMSIHAGLECGIIGDRVGDMDMISMGPDIRDVHIPGERVSISSMKRFWNFFLALLKKLD